MAVSHNRMQKLLVVILVLSLLCLTGCGPKYLKYEDKAIDATKSYVLSQFYNDYKTAADEIECTVIYNAMDSENKPIHLIAAVCKCDGAAVASYCVYTKLGTFRDATNALSPDYDYFGNSKEVKAFFGVVDEYDR